MLNTQKFLLAALLLAALGTPTTALAGHEPYTSNIVVDNTHERSTKGEAYTNIQDGAWENMPSGGYSQHQFPEWRSLVNRVPLYSGKKSQTRHLPGLNFANQNLRFANFKHHNVMGANFTRAILVDSRFNHAYASGANFYGAELMGTDFGQADLSGTDLRSANLSGCRFTHANLREARYNKHTVFPANFVPSQQFMVYQD